MEKCTWASGKQNINIMVKEFVIKVGAFHTYSLTEGLFLLLCSIVYFQRPIIIELRLKLISSAVLYK